jgi:hypothetical protein
MRCRLWLAIERDQCTKNSSALSRRPQLSGALSSGSYPLPPIWWVLSEAARAYSWPSPSYTAVRHSSAAQYSILTYLTDWEIGMRVSRHATYAIPTFADVDHRNLAALRWPLSRTCYDRDADLLVVFGTLLVGCVVVRGVLDNKIVPAGSLLAPCNKCQSTSRLVPSLHDLVQ